MAAFRSLIYRLLNYNLSEMEYNKEKSIIEQIAVNNGYKPHIISDLIRNITRRSKHQQNSSQNSDETKKYIPLNYIDKTTEKIGKIFKKAGYNPAFKTHKETIPTYNQFKNKPDIDNQRGVYKITCSDEHSDCEKQYIGYTNRTFKQRWKEHNTAHYTKPSSLVALHLKNNQTHKIDYPNSLKILKKTNNKNLASAYESYEIYKHVNKYGSDSLLNRQEDIRNSVLFQLSYSIESRVKDTDRGFPQNTLTITTPPTAHLQAHPARTMTKDASQSPSRHRAADMSIKYRRRPPSCPVSGSARTMTPRV